MESTFSKLCRICKKNYNDIKELRNDINRIEKILLTSAGVLITGMASVIIVLIKTLVKLVINKKISV